MKKIAIAAALLALVWAQDSRSVKFDDVTITGYQTIRSKLGKERVTLDLTGTIVLDAPSQGLNFAAPKITVTVRAPEDRNQNAIVEAAEASGNIQVVYKQKDPARTVNGRAARATYSEQTKKIVLTGNVYVRSEDENYIIVQESADQATIDLGVDPIEVEIQGDPNKNKTTVTLKKPPAGAVKSK